VGEDDKEDGVAASEALLSSNSALESIGCGSSSNNKETLLIFLPRMRDRIFVAMGDEWY
jgi:hypothetical protein